MLRRSFLRMLLVAPLAAAAVPLCKLLAPARAPAEVANERFLRNLESEEGRRQIADGASSYIKRRLREESFARRIMRPVAVRNREVVRHVCVSQDDGYCLCALQHS